MTGSKTEYDEKGITFYYFLLSVWAAIVISATLFVFPRRKSKAEKERIRRKCNCTPCNNKRQTVSTSKPIFKIAVIFIGWIVLLLLAYKVSTVQNEDREYDPFEILQVDTEASLHEIKKAYRKLSLEHHPDMATGDSEMFMKIAKAYAALTDEESRNNWKTYGHPDGPGAIIFGMALPNWIFDKSGSFWIFVVYIVVFIVIMPIGVGFWWYYSKFSKGRVLNETHDLYMHCLYHSPNIKPIKLLGYSWEFNYKCNPKIEMRPTEGKDELMKLLNKKKKKKKAKKGDFLGCGDIARALLQAQLTRHTFENPKFKVDQIYILQKFPALIDKMVEILAQLVPFSIHMQRQDPKLQPTKKKQPTKTAKKERKKTHKPSIPSLKTIESCMRLSQLITQALDVEDSPIKQLPHIGPDIMRLLDDNLSIRDFVDMDTVERRSLLKDLNESQYNDVMNVCALMPYVTMSATCEVKGDEDSTITVGSTVTVTVSMRRKNIIDERDVPAWADKLETLTVNVSQASDVTNIDQTIKGWRKIPSKKGKKKTASNKAKGIKVQGERAKTQKNELPKEKYSHETEKEHCFEKDTESEDDESTGNKETIDEKEWKTCQDEIKSEISLDTKRESHQVHCPYFPDEKQEGWWLYVADRKNNMLFTAPVHIVSLKDEKEIKVQLKAPSKVGIFTYTVIIRSDCYVDLDYHQTIKLDVKAAKKTDAEQDKIKENEESKEGCKDNNDSDYSSENDELSDSE
ncbi:translocation protein SEC63 homolog isoform X2 [Dreissena polymorpha]|uniref:translocation protein SEC63 homolog isoform X2 n=1 Tax=Dreissena polymorpha TaxID=45954 RepID=UPI002263EB36|nr:translocation protein SEC63 homolog isoform X2 [Dreissena polymorpha]